MKTQILMGALMALAMGTVGCGTHTAAGHPPSRWRVVKQGSFTVTREATAVVVPSGDIQATYKGAVTRVTRDARRVGQMVTRGTPLAWLQNGQVVLAPASGTVQAIVPAGAYVGTLPPGLAAPGGAHHMVAIISRTTPLTMVIRVPEVDISDWPEGAKIRDKSPFDGTIVSRVHDRQGFWTVKATFPKAPSRKIQTRAVVKVNSRTFSHVLKVPAGSILSEGPSGFSVRTRAGIVPVTVLAANARTVAVRGNLHANERVWTPTTLGAAGLRAPAGTP